MKHIEGSIYRLSSSDIMELERLKTGGPIRPSHGASIDINRHVPSGMTLNNSSKLCFNPDCEDCNHAWYMLHQIEKIFESDA